MKHVLGVIAATVIGVVWLVTFKVTPIDTEASAPAAPPGNAASREPAPEPTLTGRTATATPTAVSASLAASGTFMGNTIRTIYGDVQVRIVVSGQQVTDVQAIQLPRDRARSAAISQYSAPILRSEAIRAQSATIDIVSGATYTSVAYSRSLDSALQQAHRG